MSTQATLDGHRRLVELQGSTGSASGIPPTRSCWPSCMALVFGLALAASNLYLLVRVNSLEQSTDTKLHDHEQSINITSGKLQYDEELISQLRSNNSRLLRNTSIGWCDCHFNRTGRSDGTCDKDHTYCLVQCLPGYAVVGLSVTTMDHGGMGWELEPVGRDGSKGAIKCCRPCLLPDAEMPDPEPNSWDSEMIPEN